MTGNSHYNWVIVGTVTLKWAAAVSRGIPRICRGEPQNLANGAAEFGKIFRGKLWSLVIIAVFNKTVK